MKVIGIGASAGGMEALTTFLKVLPINTGAAYVLIQHLSPSHKSIMNEILRKYTQMPVVAVSENTTPIPNTLYINVPKKNLSFQYGMLVAKDRDTTQALHLPIDDFFHSLGDALGKDAIGIILSGSGTDGSRGCRTIKEKGGLIFVQEAKSAAFDGMPKSVIDLEIGDVVAPPDELATTLAEVLKRQTSNGDLSQEKVIEDFEYKGWFDKIMDHIRSVTNIDFKEYREPTLLRRMHNRMMLQKVDELEDYYHFLEREEGEVKALYKDFFIGVTSFFRDQAAFEELRKVIIPEIVKKNTDTDTIRIWVTACSTGEEAYSIAILLDDYLKTNGIHLTYKVFASDINPQAIKIASQGIYTYNLLADVPDDLLVAYFGKRGDRYIIKQEVRDNMLFAVHNMLSDPPFIRMNMISCRNFLIYLKPTTQRKLLTTFHFALNPEGYLFLGASETLGDLKSAFTKKVSKWNVFQRKENNALTRSQSVLSDRRGQLRTVSPVLGQQASLPELADFLKADIDPFTDYLAAQFSPVFLFVDHDLNIIYANKDIESLLNISLAAEDINLGNVLPEEAKRLFENSVRQTLAKGEMVTYEDYIIYEAKDSTTANLTFKSLALEDVASPLVLIEITVQGAESKRHQEFEELKKQRLFSDRQQRLERELFESKDRMNQLVVEQEGVNTELQNSNRELYASNEELQSTNEELQSINEELYTVNNELQYKNEQLNTANNDLLNILRSTEIGIIFLNTDLSIRKFTPAAQRQFYLVENDIGRKITNFSHSLEGVNIGQLCRRVYTSLEAQEVEINDEEDNYLLRVLPYKNSEGEIEGLVIYFLSIQELVRTRRAVKRLANKYDLLFTHSEDFIVEINEAGIITRANQSRQGISIDNMSGQSAYQLLENQSGDDLEPYIAEAIATRETISVRDFNNGKYFFDLCIIPMKDKYLRNREGIQMILIAEEVTGSRNEVMQLEVTVERYKQLLEGFPYQVMLVEESGVIVYLNKSEDENISRQSVVGTNVIDYLSEEDGQRYLASLKAIFSGQPFDEITFSYPMPKGGAKQFEMIAMPVILHRGIRLTAIISRDVFAS